jgi:hypothetical protein
MAFSFVQGYYCLGYLTHRYSFLYIFINTFESGGIYWPSVASRILASLFFSHITLIGLCFLPHFDPATLNSAFV